MIRAVPQITRARVSQRAQQNFTTWARSLLIQQHQQPQHSPSSYQLHAYQLTPQTTSTSTSNNNNNNNNNNNSNSSNDTPKKRELSKYLLPLNTKSASQQSNKEQINTPSTQPPLRRPRTARFKKETIPDFNNVGATPTSTPSSASSASPFSSSPSSSSSTTTTIAPEPKLKTEPVVNAEPKSTPDSESTTTAAPKKLKKRVLKPRKQLITLTPSAISHLEGLMNQPTPKLIRIGVRNRGCSGLTYDLDYVEKPGKFDELIEQDGVKVLIDSKALFSIVGSEMDWLDDKLSSRFIFKNPNSKGTCGCGESFMV